MHKVFFKFIIIMRVRDLCMYWNVLLFEYFLLLATGCVLFSLIKIDFYGFTTITSMHDCIIYMCVCVRVHLIILYLS